MERALLTIVVEPGGSRLQITGRDERSMSSAYAAQVEAVLSLRPSRVTLEVPQEAPPAEALLLTIEHIGMRCTGRGVTCRVLLPGRVHDLLEKSAWMARLEQWMLVSLSPSAPSDRLALGV